MMNEGSRENTTLAVLAELVGGRVSGDPSTCISGVAPLGVAGARDICFLANPKAQDRLDGCQAAAIIVPPSLDGVVDKPLLLVDNPYLAFAKILNFLKVPERAVEGVSVRADVHPDAVIGPETTISPGCVVGAGVVVGRGSWLSPNVVVYPDVTIGEDCVIHANVVIREGCRLGDRVIIQPGAVIGADGFGYVPDGEHYYKIPQVGTVVLEDDVEVGACTCIDRGTLGDTRVARGTKIDNLVQVAHNTQVGEDCILISQMGLAGSVKVGRHCTISGQVAVSDHVTIGDHVTIAGKSGVTNDVDSHQVMAGFPAMPHRQWLRANMTIQHLPDMRKDLQTLKKQVAELLENKTEDDV